MKTLSASPALRASRAATRAATHAAMLGACLLVSACGTTFPLHGESLLREPERSRVATQFANGAKLAYRCDKVDSLVSEVIRRTPAANGQGPLTPGDGSVAERWALQLCGRRVEAEVYHGLDKNGRPVSALRPL